MKKLLISVLCTLLLTGCGTTRPRDDAAYKAAVSAVTNSENIIFNHSGVWLPNQSKINLRSMQTFDGNITITDKAVYFMEWDPDTNAYAVTMKRSISDIKAIKFDAFGRTQLFFIGSGETTWDGLGCGSMTENAYKYLKSVIHDTAGK